MKKYRPSHGTEGDLFEDRFCANCQNIDYNLIDEGDQAGDCDILSRSFWCEIDDDDYPEEWCYDEKGKPTCTAFKKSENKEEIDGN